MVAVGKEAPSQSHFPPQIKPLQAGPGCCDGTGTQRALACVRPNETRRLIPNPSPIRNAPMSSIRVYRVRTARLTAMKMALIVALVDLAAGMSVMLHQPGGRMSEMGARAEASAVTGAAADTPQGRRGKGWRGIEEAIASGFTGRAQVFDLPGLPVLQRDASAMRSAQAEPGPGVHQDTALMPAALPVPTPKP